MRKLIRKTFKKYIIYVHGKDGSGYATTAKPGCEATLWNIFGEIRECSFFAHFYKEV